MCLITLVWQPSATGMYETCASSTDAHLAAFTVDRFVSAFIQGEKAGFILYVGSRGIHVTSFPRVLLGQRVDIGL